MAEPESDLKAKENETMQQFATQSNLNVTKYLYIDYKFDYNDNITVCEQILCERLMKLTEA